MVSTANCFASEGIRNMKPRLFVAAAVAAILASAPWSLDAQSRGDHWGGTWASAVVPPPQEPAGAPAPAARPQAPAGGPLAPPQLPLTASGQPNVCPPAVFGPPPGGARGGA